MPYSPQHKQQSRERILESALQLFTRQGFEHTSIDQIMANAGLTRGAFYAHFSSKQDLYAQAIASTPLFSIFGKVKPEDIDDKDWLDKLLSGYLSKVHIQKTETPCPLAFMVTDVAVNEPETREVYTDVFLGLNTIIRKYTNTYQPADKQTVMAVTAMMIGGVAIARTLSDSKAQDLLLKSCRQVAKNLLVI
jgi:AcrR family transcriptional regulator